MFYLEVAYIEERDHNQLGFKVVISVPEKNKSENLRMVMFIRFRKFHTFPIFIIFKCYNCKIIVNRTGKQKKLIFLNLKSVQY